MAKEKPVYAQCSICSKKYDMVVWGVRCPTCKDKKPKKR
jgi:Zn finger protein HypA/HybF involved in hydrogenase expression